MKTIEQLTSDVFLFLHHLFSPETLSVVTILSGAGWKLYASIKKNFDERFDRLEATNNNTYRDIQKEVLRLQLLEGMDAKRLSSSEVQYFYDKYRTFGGNSFVTEKVQEYLDQIQGGKGNDQKSN